jgi:UDPglucose 6-dehydrogenase
VDSNQAKIQAWNSTSADDLPIYEPGLAEIVQSCRGRNLVFDTNEQMAITEADIIFIAVHCPTKESGHGGGYAQDLVHIEQTARTIARFATTPKIVVEKGTFPVRTAQAIQRILDHNCTSPDHNHVVLSNPEFLAQGTAVVDILEPSRVLIGGPQARQDAVQTLVDVYAQWVPTDRILTTSTWSSELSKLVANALLAQRVSSINSISALCEATGADVTEIAKAVGMDKRIGPKFLNASVGFGKSRFRKDIYSLIYLCESYGLDECAQYWRSVVHVNNFQKKRFSSKVVHKMFSTVTGKKLAMLGYAFKKDTGDVRETPSMFVLHDLLQEEAQVHVYDPRVKRGDMLREFDVTCGVNYDTTPQLDRLVVTALDPYAACEGAHAVLLMTDWDEFHNLDYQRIVDNMAKPAFLFDGRNMLDHDALRKIGFEVHGIGKPDPNEFSDL